MLPPMMLIAFPNLEWDDGKIETPADPSYNCVAWAVGVTDAFWWPCDPDAYWPAGVLDELSLSAMIEVLGSVGYVSCGDSRHEPGFENVAMYLRDGAPTHVARQLQDGRWSSKLGRDSLVSHATPAGVEGPVYGVATAFLRRPIFEGLASYTELG